MVIVELVRTGKVVVSGRSVSLIQLYAKNAGEASFFFGWLLELVDLPKVMSNAPG